MEWLRISLLILGVLLVAAIWTVHHLRSRSRNDARPQEPEVWDDDGVHIRAERDDRPPGVRPLGENLSLPLEQEDDPSPAPRVRWQPLSRKGASPAKSPVSSAPEDAEQPAAAGRPTREESAVPGDSTFDDVSAPRVVGRNPLAAGARNPAAAKGAGATDPLGQIPTADRDPHSARSQGRASAAVRNEERSFDDVSAPRVVGRNPLAARGGREKILILHVVAPRNRPFTGVALGAALRRAGLRLGEMSIYHLCANDGSGDVLFSAANMVSPGTLTDEDLADMMTPGITLFLQLHLCDQPRQAFDALLETSHALARDLGGNIFDAQQSTATNQTLSHMRDELNEWLLRHRPDLLRRKVER